MSLTGLAIEAPERLEVGRSHLIGFRHRSGGRMEIRGQVVWCHMIDNLSSGTGGKASYRAGIELEDVLSSQSRKMQLFLESQADMSLDQRIFGRFEPLAGDSEIDIATRYRFTIKTVSRSGLSIESEYLPPIHSTLHLAISLADRVVELEARVAQIKPTRREIDGHRLHEIGLEPTDWPDNFDPLGDLLERASGVAMSRSPGYETNVFTVSSDRQAKEPPGR